MKRTASFFFRRAAGAAALLAASSVLADVANTAYAPNVGTSAQGTWRNQTYTPAVGSDPNATGTVYLQTWVMIQPNTGITTNLNTSSNIYASVIDATSSVVVGVSTGAVSWITGFGQTITPWRFDNIPLGALSSNRVVFSTNAPLVVGSTVTSLNAGSDVRLGGLINGNEYTGGQVFNASGPYGGDAWFYAVHTTASNAWTALDASVDTPQSAIWGVSTGPGGIRKTGAGGLVIDLVNAWDGDHIIEQGSLVLTNGGALGTGVVNLVAWGAQASRPYPVGTLLVLEDNATLSNTVRGVGGLRVRADALAPAAILSANTFRGDTRLESGTLGLSNADALAYSTLDLDGADAGVIDFGGLTGAAVGGLKGARPLALTNASGAAVYLTVGLNGYSNVFAGGLIGGSGLTKTGTGTQAFSVNNLYAGDTIVAQGLLRLDADQAVPGGINDIMVGTSLIRFRGGILGLGYNDFRRGLGTGVTDVVFEDAGGFAAYGATRTVDVGNASAVLLWGQNGFVPDGKALLLGAADASATVNLVNPLDLLGQDRTFEVANGPAAVDAELAGALQTSAGTAGLVKRGAGTLRLSAANLYNGSTAIEGGILQIGNAGAIPPGSVVTQANVAGTALDLNGLTNTVGGLSGGGAAGGNVTNSSTNALAVLTISNATLETYAGAIRAGSSNIAVVKLGSGTQVLSGASTYTGGTTIADGALVYGSGQALGRGANNTAGYYAKPFVLRHGTVDFNNQFTYTPGPGGAASLPVGVVLFDAALVCGGQAGGVMQINAAGTNAWGAGATTTLVYDAANVPGALTIAAPFLASGSSGGTTRELVIGDSAGAAVEVDFVAQVGIPDPYRDGRSTTLRKSGAGTLRLSTSNYFPGLRVSGGLLVVNDALALGASRTASGGSAHLVTVDGGTIDLNGFSPSIGGLSDGGVGTGVIVNSNGVPSVLTVGSSGASTAYGGLIQDGFPLGPVGLVKVGAGMLTLSGANMFSSTARVEVGTLVLSGSGALAGAGAILVQTGATLAVTGRVDGALTVGAFQTLGGGGTVVGLVTNAGLVAPGLSAGQLTITSNYVQDAAGTLRIEIDSGTNDLLAIGGTGLATLGGTLDVQLLNAYDPPAGSVFTGVTAALVQGAFSTTTLPALAGGKAWQMTNDGAAVILSVQGAALTGYDAWAAGYGFGPGSEGGDSDNDRLPNLFEYSQGTDPTVSNAVTTVTGSRSNGVLQLHFNVVGAATDISYIAESTYAVTNGALWTPVWTNLNGTPVGTNFSGLLGPGTNRITVYDLDPTAAQRAMRLRVTRP